MFEIPPRMDVKITLSGIFGIIGIIIISYGAMLTMGVTAGEISPVEAADAILFVGAGFVCLLMAFFICLKGPRF